LSIWYNIAVESLKSIGSYFGWKSQGAAIQEGGCAKFTRVAAGVGAAGLAIISWKFIAAGALAYSAYRSGRYLNERYFQRKDAVVEEVKRAPEPVTEGHDAHGDQQKPFEQSFEDFVEDLRKMQTDAKTSEAKRVYDLLISHPKLSQKMGDFVWIRKVLDKHVAWSKRTFGLSSHFVKAYRKVQSCVPK
jgi:hypothetical protein